jgi:thiol:disulfide interchange protein
MSKPLLFSLVTCICITGFIPANVESHQAAGDMQFQRPHPQKDSSQIKIIENYNNITSVSQLLDSFKGKPVFIDVWATWCMPCFEEFRFSAPLHEFLKQKDIEIIYVSLDKETEDIVWRNKIIENKLSGNHIRAGKPLRDDLTTLIWGGIDVYSLPVGKN